MWTIGLSVLRIVSLRVSSADMLTAATVGHRLADFEVGTPTPEVAMEY